MCDYVPKTRMDLLVELDEKNRELITLHDRVNQLEACIKRMRGSVNKQTGEILCG